MTGFSLQFTRYFLLGFFFVSGGCSTSTDVGCLASGEGTVAELWERHLRAEAENGFSAKRFVPDG